MYCIQTSVHLFSWFLLECGKHVGHFPGPWWHGH